MAKSKLKNKTIQGNVAAIVGTIGTLVSMFQMHVPPEIVVAAVGSAIGSVGGNLFSLWAAIKGGSVSN